MFKTKTPSSYEALSSRDEESPLTLTERSRAEVDVVRVTVTRTPLWVKLCLFLSWLFIAIQVGFDFRLLSNNNGDARVEANRPNLDFPLPTGLLYCEHFSSLSSRCPCDNTYMTQHRRNMSSSPRSRDSTLASPKTSPNTKASHLMSSTPSGRSCITVRLPNLISTTTGSLIQC